MHDIEESIPIEEEGHVNIHVTYSKPQKKKIWALLASYDPEKVYTLCNERVPLSTLKQWKADIEKGKTVERKKGSGRKIKHPKLEEALLEWFVFQRARTLPINNKTLQNAAKIIAEELKIRDFKASKGFIDKFKRRNSLVTRRRTRLSTKPIEEMKELIIRFYEEVNSIIELYPPDKVWNYDEVPIFFEPNFTYTIAPKGEKAVSILSLMANKMRMTLVVTISASGRMIPSIMLFFSKGFYSFTMGGNLIESNTTAYANEEFIYAKTLPHIIQHIGDNSLLLFDSCKAHLSGRIKALLSSHNITYLAIPGGATCLLQPVDCGIGKMIKGEAKNEFESWCFKEFQAITAPEGRRKKTFKKPTNNQVAEWLVKSCAKLPSDAIKKAFIETGITSKEKQADVTQHKVQKYYVDTKIEIDYLHYD